MVITQLPAGSVTLSKYKEKVMSSNIISEDVLNKIGNALERSSFGSGEMIAGILMDPSFQMPVETGVWEIGLEEDCDGDYYISYYHRDDNVMRGPSWQTRVSFSIDIRDNTIEFLLGCGVHSASCIFNKSSGDLIEVIPDNLPSERFWGDGDRPNLRALREFLRMTTPVYSHA
jgi:hypothetical protein